VRPFKPINASSVGAYRARRQLERGLKGICSQSDSISEHVDALAKVGVKPSQIARQFGLSQSAVPKAMATMSAGAAAGTGSAARQNGNLARHADALARQREIELGNRRKTLWDSTGPLSAVRHRNQLIILIFPLTLF
jgi:hypothetical protein